MEARPRTRPPLVAALLVAIGAIGGWTARELLPPEPVGEAAGVGVPVRLVLHAPGARSVTVAGTFNAWDPASTPLVRGDGDVFYVTVEIPHGRHEYMFVVDGARWVADPAAPLTRPDDFGHQNGVLDV